MINKFNLKCIINDLNEIKILEFGLLGISNDVKKMYSVSLISKFLDFIILFFKKNMYEDYDFQMIIFSSYKNIYELYIIIGMDIIYNLKIDFISKYLN